MKNKLLDGMKRKLALLAGMALPFCALAQPTDNPISKFYNGAEGYPAWTDGIKWSNVYNMATMNYSGCATCAGNDFEKFKYVRDIAYTAGGGVLYYPAGTYFFQIPDDPNGEGLMLKKGVVIRGEEPSSDKKAVLAGIDIDAMSVTDHGLKSLPTKFVFDTTTLGGNLARGIGKMWNAVGIKKGSGETGLQDVNNVGICWVEMEYGYIYFGFSSNQWAATWANAGYDFAKSIGTWRTTRVPDGTHPMDPFAGNKVWNQDSMMMGMNRFVFGVHIKHGGVPDYVVNKGFQNYISGDAPWHFGAKISVYGSHVLIANNVISKPTKAFKMNITPGVAYNGNYVPKGTAVEVPYDWGKGYSIDVNKNYVSGYINRSVVNDDRNGQYAAGVIIIDNWAYNHSNKGFDIGGGWMTVKNNVNRRERYKKNVDVYNLGLTTTYGVFASIGGVLQSQGNDDFLARAFTVSSRNAWLDGNQWRGIGTDFDNSGEGMLIQDHHNGSECYSAAFTNNKGESYVGVWNSHAIGLMLGYNKVTTDILFFPYGAYGADVSVVQQVNKNTNVPFGNFDESANIKENVKDYKVFDCSASNPTPGIPTVTVKDTTDYVIIEWNNVTNEAGYRVQRRKTGETAWATVAYRPRQQTGGVVTFDFGTVLNGFIATSHGHPNLTWDKQVRNMNPPIWRDYTKVAGTYEYRVVAVGCDDLDVSASDPEEVEIVNNYLDETGLSSSKLQAPIEVYPNPSSGVVNFSLPEGVDVSAGKLISTTGKTVRTIDAGAASTNVGGLAPGIYILEITHSKGVSRGRVVVE